MGLITNRLPDNQQSSSSKCLALHVDNIGCMDFVEARYGLQLHISVTYLISLVYLVHLIDSGLVYLLCRIYLIYPICPINLSICLCHLSSLIQSIHHLFIYSPCQLFFLHLQAREICRSVKTPCHINSHQSMYVLTMQKCLVSQFEMILLAGRRCLEGSQRWFPQPLALVTWVQMPRAASTLNMEA